MNGPLRRDTLGIAEEAADWLIALRSGDIEVKTAFVKWLRTSPRHVEEFLLVTASDVAMQDLDAGRRVDADGMMGLLTGNVIGVKAGKPGITLPLPKPRSLKTTRWVAGLAAAVAGLTITSGWLLGYFSGWETYTAAIGEQRTVQLTDGSLVYLNARSQIKVRLSDGRRDIRLLEGEALFEVARDPSRPFRVETDRATIRAVGTQFNVDRRSRDTQVTVIEGAVEITPTSALQPARKLMPSTEDARHIALPAQLTAGQEVRIQSNGQATRFSGNVESATAWRQRRLIFSDNTLEEIVDEFNRYNRGRRLVIEENTLRDQRYGGTFKADEPVALIEYLKRTPGLAVTEEKDQWTIRSR